MPSTTGFTTGVGQGESLQTSFHAPTMRGLDSLPLLEPSASVSDEKEVGAINKQIPITPITPTHMNFEFVLADLKTYLLRCGILS